MSESAARADSAEAQAPDGPTGGADLARATLSERDRRILDFEREWVRGAGAKEDAVRSKFGLSAARYYQVLNALLDSPAALEHDPLLVRRLQRLRHAGSSARTVTPIRTEDPSRHR